MAFTCPQCRRTSHNPNDERFRYCGACHQFFPEEIDEPADVSVLSGLVAEARTVAAHAEAMEYPAAQVRHWRAVVAWLAAHLPPEHSAVSPTPPCPVCLDLGVSEVEGKDEEWEPCTCLIGQYLGDLSA